MDWLEEYKRKLVSADEAVKVVKSGDRVGIPIGEQPEVLMAALAKRKGELHDVEVCTRSPQKDVGWLQPGWEESFRVDIDMVTGIAVPALDKKIVDYTPYATGHRFKADDDGRTDARPIDVAFIILSPPDKNGWCSFGTYLSLKKGYAKRAKKVIAQVDQNLIRLFGDGYFHVSDVEQFVEAPSPSKESSEANAEYTDEAKAVAGYVSSLLQDGDCIQLGPGALITALPGLGVFDDKHDLGVHSAYIGREFFQAIKKGMFTCSRKNVDKDKIMSAAYAVDVEDMHLLVNNPRFWLREQEYVNHLMTIAAQDNMVAINGAISIDLTGQIGADTIGTRLWHGAAGQIEYAMGSVLSKGGRSITIVQSTAARGKVSRVVSLHDQGTVVSVLRTYADYVVSEYGIASLMGKSLRQRADELIAIAHPDFRPQLKEAAKKLFWP
ncbi:MAG: acetyl-CoA hydrolase/transferase C-terminal domain-containing protein [Chloroflexota bacterium]